MEFKPTPIPGLMVLQPKYLGDHRGHFAETYRKELFESHGLPTDFVQENESLSGQGILRGLHFQAPPYAQGKLVRVVRGRVLDVAVDLRKASPSFGKWYRVELGEDNGTMFWIPPGFAHGFLTLEPSTLFQYKCTHYYHPSSEGGLRWNDPNLAIDWNRTDEQPAPMVSAKDQNLPYFEDFNSPFE
jgi:dTDP-4-dehydrorhamnose 3,5-epimerase